MMWRLAVENRTIATNRRTNRVAPASDDSALPWRWTGIGLVGFTLLFPGFLIYQFLAINGVIPQIIPGGYGEAALAVLLPTAVGARDLLRTMWTAAPMAALLYLTLVVFVVCWTLVSVAVDPTREGIAAGTQAASTAALWGALAITGFLLTQIIDSHRGYFVVIAFALVGAMLTIQALSGASFLYLSGYYAGHSASSDATSYQQLARSVVVASIAAVASTKLRLFASATLAIATILALVFIGARSELVGFAFAVAALGVFTTLRRPGSSLALIALVALSLVSAALLADQGALSSLTTSANPRVAALLNIGQDESYRQRTELAEAAWTVILASPVLGDLAGHVTPDLGTGAYRHDWLSAWAAFGIFGFLLYAAALIHAAATSFGSLARSRELPSHWAFAAVISLMTLLLAVTTKSVFWEMPALAWGAVLGARSMDRRSDKTERPRTNAR